MILCRQYVLDILMFSYLSRSPFLVFNNLVNLIKTSCETFCSFHTEPASESMGPNYYNINLYY
jgi:hypothetical protein